MQDEEVVMSEGGKGGGKGVVTFEALGGSGVGTWGKLNEDRSTLAGSTSTFTTLSSPSSTECMDRIRLQ